METTGYSRWFERLLAELAFEIWIGDAAVWPGIRLGTSKSKLKSV
jgi:hypothetical protein